jgi:multidrug efflux pump subunit AcrB
MVFAMTISFLFSITLAPLLASMVLKERDIEREIEQAGRRSALARWYERALPLLLRRRWLVLPSMLGIVLLTTWFYDRIGNDFMPDMDEGAFVLDYLSPPGTSLNETDRMLMDVEKVLESIPEVESYSRRTGTQLGFFLTEPNNGDFLVKLKKIRSRRINDVITEVRARVSVSEPALTIEFGQLMMDVIGDLTNNPSPVEIKLFGEDEKTLQTKAREVSKLISQVPGVVDVFDGIVIAGPSLVVRLDPLASAEAGIGVDDAQEQLEAVIRGKSESTVQRGEKLIAVRVRYPQAYHFDVDRLEEVRLVNGSGIPVPLRSIAMIEKTEGKAELRREGLRQMIAVTARIKDRDLVHTVEEIQRTLSRALVLPAGMSIVYGGVYQVQQESFRGLLLVALAAITLVFIVLLIEFGEFAVPVSIFAVNILSLVGVFGALWLTGVSFNISSFVGIIMIIGIVAENAIFVMHTVRTLQAEGVPLDAALVQATRVRARPIIMTTLAAVFALLPLSLGIGAGAQMQQPLAVAVIGGFSLSSALLFFGLPLVYRLLSRQRMLPAATSVNKGTV